jgi:CRP-like cAMP-binding protein
MGSKRTDWGPMREDRFLRIGREVFLAALGVPLEEVDSWVIDRLTFVLDEQRVRRGQKLFTAGEPLESLYFMQNGQVRFAREGGPSWTVRGRWLLGGFEALGDRPAPHSVVALEDFDAMRVPAAAWVELLEDSFQLGRLAVVNYSRALMQVEERSPTGAPVSLPPESLSPTAAARSMIGPVESLALLLDAGMLRNAGVQALADLVSVSREVSFAAGESIIERGVECPHLVRLIEGDVLAEHEAPAMSRRYRSGDLVCDAAVLGQVAAKWQARAIAPTRGLSFPVEALFDLMEEHFDLLRSVLASLGARRQLLLEHLAASEDLVLT